MTGFSLSQEELVQWNCVENSLQKISISITLLKIVVLLRCLLHYHKSFCSIAKHFKSHVNYLLLFGKFRDARDLHNRHDEIGLQHNFGPQLARFRIVYLIT